MNTIFYAFFVRRSVGRATNVLYRNGNISACIKDSGLIMSYEFPPTCEHWSVSKATKDINCYLYVYLYKNLQLRVL